MRKTTNVEIELRTGNNERIAFYLKQYDDVILDIKIFDGLSAIDIDGQIVTLAIKKPDGTNILQKNGISTRGKTILIDMSEQAVSCAGVCEMELILEDSDGIMTTSTTKYIVSESLASDILDVITSTNDIHHLKLIEEYLKKAEENMYDIDSTLKILHERIEEISVEIERDYSDILSQINELKIVKDDLILANTQGEITLEKLLDAIRRAEEITQEVEAYIESKSGNHDEIYEEIEKIKNDLIDFKNEIEGIVRNAIESYNYCTLDELQEAINSIESNVATIEYVENAISNFENKYLEENTISKFNDIVKKLKEKGE